MLLFKGRKDHLSNIIQKNKDGLVCVYGLTYWTSLFIQRSKYKIDYIIDRKAIYVQGKPSLSMNGIPIINIDHGAQLMKKQEKRSTIIICAGIYEATVNSIYQDLVKKDIDADVINLFENEEFFSIKEFEYNGNSYKLFEHPFNCGYTETRMTERSVELAIAKRFIDDNDSLVEIGAVTPYYFHEDKIQEIVDPTDVHYRVSKKSLFDCNLTGKNVLSISTVEHIGTSDFGMHEKQTSIDAVNKIRDEAEHYLITVPFGYNRILDNWVMDNLHDPQVKILVRDIGNEWIETPPEDFRGGEYTPLWANVLVVIENM